MEGGEGGGGCNRQGRGVSEAGSMRDTRPGDVVQVVAVLVRSAADTADEGRARVNWLAETAREAPLCPNLCRDLGGGVG